MSLLQQQQQPEAAGPSGRSDIIPAPAPQPPRSGLPRRSGSSNSLSSGCASPPHPVMPHPGERRAGCPPAALEQYVRTTPPQLSLRPAARRCCRHAPYIWLGRAHPCVPRLPRPRGGGPHRSRRFAARRCAAPQTAAATRPCQLSPLTHRPLPQPHVTLSSPPRCPLASSACPCTTPITTHTTTPATTTRPPTRFPLSPAAPPLASCTAAARRPTAPARPTAAVPRTLAAARLQVRCPPTRWIPASRAYSAGTFV